MPTDVSFVDIHCHLIPGIDDGAVSWEESLAMARMAVDDGIRTVIATPHQLGAFRHNSGVKIRKAAAELQGYLSRRGVDLVVLPGADVRIEPEMVAEVCQGRVLTLADQHRHVLLELPHETYIPLGECLSRLHYAGLVGILSHPERNQGLLRQPNLVLDLLQSGCLMQITAGSLLGNFGPRSQAMSERMVANGNVHFVATDAHGAKSRRPLMYRAHKRVVDIAGWEMAQDICCRNPARVAAGQAITARATQSRKSGMARWLPWRNAA